MYLSKDKIKAKIDEYVAQKTAKNLPWDTLEYDYLLKDLHSDIWDNEGEMLDETHLD